MSETYETDRATYESRLKHKGFQRGYRAAVNALRDTITGDMNQDRDPNSIAQ